VNEEDNERILKELHWFRKELEELNQESEATNRKLFLLITDVGKLATKFKSVLEDATREANSRR
jgi:hypothetical protein